jgi:hypothetical protein
MRDIDSTAALTFIEAHDLYQIGPLYTYDNDLYHPCY